MDLSGKVAIITGAARGQGEAEARLFAEREPGALAFGLLAGLGILCAVVALVIWLATPLFNG